MQISACRYFYNTDFGSTSFSCRPAPARFNENPDKRPLVVIHENLVAVMKSSNFSRLFAASLRFIDQFIIALVGERRPF